MEYVMHVSVPDEVLDGVDAIENASSLIQDILDYQHDRGDLAGRIVIRPLSEVIAC